MAAIVMGNESMCLAMIVFAYSVICLFSFMNVSYVRDFEVVQINFTPISLAVFGLTNVMGRFDFATLGMTLALVFDSYYALRFKETSDSIEYNAFELFAQESWTQQAFDKTNTLGLQIAAISMIFVQIFLTMVGTVNGNAYQALFLSFYLARLLQFFLKTVKGLEMFQSNMACVVLTAMALSSMTFDITCIQGMLMFVDAYVGAFIFVITKNIQVGHIIDKLPISLAQKLQKRIRLVEVDGQQDEDENFHKC
jgi:hypothetical protein